VTANMTMIPSLSPANLLECAVRAVHAAGEHALANPGRRSESLAVSHHDVKLALDVECQQIAEEVIRSTYPAHAILGEESTGYSTTGDGGIEWIIDPIDGTVNFSHGLARWCCSIAVRRDDTMLAGAVFAPQLDELYTAAAGIPSALNGNPARVSSAGELSASLVFTGFAKDMPEDIETKFQTFRRIAMKAQKTRIMGAAALDICEVACGRGEGYYESGIYIWDIAAAGLIVRQAGGRTDILRKLDAERLVFLATNGNIHEELKAIATR